MKTYVAMMYGQGDDAVDIALTGGGMDRLAQRIRALGSAYQVEQLRWNEAASIADRVAKLNPDKLVVGGDSLGACETPFAASLIKRQVDLIFGIQPSLYGRHIPVPSNVKKAIYWYQPWGIAAGIGFGYGSYQWELAPGNTVTKVESAYTFVSHPGTNSESVQDAILQKIKQL